MDTQHLHGYIYVENPGSEDWFFCIKDLTSQKCLILLAKRPVPPSTWLHVCAHTYTHTHHLADLKELLISLWKLVELLNNKDFRHEAFI